MSPRAAILLYEFAVGAVAVGLAIAASDTTAAIIDEWVLGALLLAALTPLTPAIAELKLSWGGASAEIKTWPGHVQISAVGGWVSNIERAGRGPGAE